MYWNCLLGTFPGGGWVKVEIKAILAQPTELELDWPGLSFAIKETPKMKMTWKTITTSKIKSISKMRTASMMTIIKTISKVNRNLKWRKTSFAIVHLAGVYATLVQWSITKVLNISLKICKMGFDVIRYLSALSLCKLSPGYPSWSILWVHNISLSFMFQQSVWDHIS